MKIKPENITNRTKVQIVQEAESTWLLPRLVLTADCPPECRCMVCWHKLADRVINQITSEPEPIIIERFVDEYR